MRFIAPRTGAPEVDIAESQHEYKQLVGAVYVNSQYGPTATELVFRITMSEEERLQIAKGADIFLGVLTFGRPLQPLTIQVGPQHYQLQEGT